MLASSLQRGDTIIEVLLAITIFSMVSIGTMSIMNQGTNTAQRALEITQVRQQIDAQAEALRAAQLAATTLDPVAVTEWKNIAMSSDTDTYTGEGCPTSQPTGTFIMDANKATKLNGTWFRNINSAGAPPYAQLLYTGGVAQYAYGMWIERDTDVAAGGVRAAYSFGINACWNGAGTNGTPQRLKTVVRLYDPS